MSIASDHNDFLRLVEPSGPFLSLPVLLRAFPQGLPVRDTEVSKEAKLRFEDWLEENNDRAVHIGWCNFVLRSVLKFPPEVIAEGQTIPPGMEAHMSEYGEVLRPSMAILPPKDAASPKPRLLIQILPPGQALEKPLKDKHWKASPATRMTELLHAADVPLGLVTNGEHWMLVHAPRGETSGFASWYAPLWFEEPLTFQAFQALLSVQRFFGVPPDETIEALLNASAKDQQEVTDQLGWQVRKAVEVLIQSLDKIDQDEKRKLLEGVGEKQLYEAALTIMMRLVFLMCAEERKILFPSDCKDYQDFYAISTLRDQLQEVADKHVEEVLDTRFDAWGRLLATFRAIYGGVQHEAMRLPPYGGTLFDPDRYPFLEGRKPGTHWRTTPAEPLKVSNRTVLHLLNALQILQLKMSGGGAAEARRISFRALDIEQIGHVYEGLLDHTAKRATEPVLGLKGGKDSEPEITLSKLEAIKAKSVDELVEFLTEETKRSDKALKKLLTGDELTDKQHLLIACDHDRDLFHRVRPYAALLREDTLGYPVVINTGSIYVTTGSDRRSTGTHYTPRSLTEPIVQHTLEPLVYTGPAEGKPKAEWKLKSPREILALKVCDMTMGSGAFLVQTCRYLAERLVEAWENAEQANPGKILATPEGDFSAGDPGERLIPADPAERLAIARRYVADRCLYGVDINPMAVEMAKLSLWLITLQRDRPFTFLDHALKCGDSLLGVSSVQQIENFSLRPGERQMTFATANLFRYVKDASAKRRELENLPSNDHTQIETKTRLFAEAEAATAKVKALADCLIAFELRGLDGNAYEAQRDVASANAQLAMQKPLKEFQIYAKALIGDEKLRPFHWPIEFPEIAESGGFNCIVGNPPFLSYYARERSDTDFMKTLANCYAFSSHTLATKRYSSAMFFWERALNVTSKEGTIGLLNDLNILEDNLQVTRSMIVEKCSLLAVVDNIRAFSVVVSGQVFIAIKNKPPISTDWTYILSHNWTNEALLKQSHISPKSRFSFNKSSRIDLPGRPLKEMFEVKSGVNLAGARNEFLTQKSESKLSRPFVSSGAIKSKLQKYVQPSAYITYSQEICASVNEAFKASGNKSVAVLGPIERFERPKLIVRQSAPEIVAIVDETHLVCSHSYFVISARTETLYDIYYLGGILSSNVLSEYAVSNDVVKIAEGKQPQLRKAGLDSLPIPTPIDQHLISAVRDVTKKIIQEEDDGKRAELFSKLDKLVEDCFQKHSNES